MSLLPRKNRRPQGVNGFLADTGLACAVSRLFGLRQVQSGQNPAVAQAGTSVFPAFCKPDRGRAPYVFTK